MGEDVLGDCNGGWTPAEALQVMEAARHRGLTFLFEQPCRTYEECLSVRRRTAQPIMLDEVFDDMGLLLRAIADDACDAINIKIGKVGGLTTARRLRDVAAQAGLVMSLQDTAGSEVSAAAILHLAQSTPARLCHSMWDPTEFLAEPIAAGKPPWVDGTMTASDAPGLGVEPHAGVLGEPVAVYTA
jgi:L-alanine-DL-glutamate epimerase-like enolase superfamily enzyme